MVWVIPSVPIGVQTAAAVRCARIEIYSRIAPRFARRSMVMPYLQGRGGQQIVDISSAIEAIVAAAAPPESY
jgi:hypothetical protein